MLSNSHLADFPQNLTACDCTKQHEFLYETTNIAQKMQEKLHKSCNPEQKTILPAVAVISYALSAFAKLKAEPENSNLLQGEQQHAYLNRAFFVRSLRTPKETQRKAIVQALRGSLSMVVRNGKGSPFADFLVGQFLSPLRTTAQTLRSLAVVLSNHYKETAMLFKFLVLGDKRLTISIRAKSEQEARQKLQFTSPALCVARYNTSRSRTNKGGIYA